MKSLVLSFCAFLTLSASLAETVALPKPDLSGRRTVEQALQSRRSVRAYAPKSITRAELGQLLWAAQGVTSPDGRRTAPSAGALYPLEITVAAARVDDLPPGLYRYLAAAHALQPVARGEFVKDIAAAALGQRAISQAAAIFVFAAVEGRTAKKYGSRASRYATFEAGCASQNLALQAVALGLGSVVVGAFDDQRLAAVVQLRADERPVVLMPAGRVR